MAATYFPDGYVPAGYLPPGYFPDAPDQAAVYFPPGYFPATYLPRGVFAAPAAETAAPTTLATAMAAVRSYLIASGTTTDTLCWVALDPEPSPLAGGVMLILTQGPQRPEGSAIDGAGREVPLLRGAFSIHVVDRSLRDVVGQDTRRLTQQAVGLLRSAHAVIDAMQVLPPGTLVDLSGDDPEAEPLRLAMQKPPRPYTRDWNWCGVELEFEILYQLDLG